MSQLSELADKVRAQLTAPGAPFEVVENLVDGRPMQVYRNAFQNLPQFIASAREHGDKPFITFQDDVWTFSRFFAEADAIAAQLLNWGVKPGDRVAVAMRNRPEWAVVLVATAMIGAVPAPINSFGLGEELLAAITDVEPAVYACDLDRLKRINDETGVAGCRILCVGDGAELPAGVADYQTLISVAAAPQPLPELAPEDPALILFTSGATSRAKGVLSSQRAVCQALFNIDFIGAFSAMTSPEAIELMMKRGLPPTTLTAVPLFHVSGLHAQLLSALRGGRHLVFVTRWDPATAMELIRDQRITQFNGAPSMVMQLLAQPGFDDPAQSGSLGGIGFGGAGLPQRLITEVMQRRPNSMSGIGYGLTETNGTAAAASGTLFAYKPKSSGVISPVVEVKVIDANGEALPRCEAGEICLRGAPVMEGYWRDEAATRAAMSDGWFRTGDVGYVDDEGFLFIVDRIKDVINRSGEKFAAAEVESCLLQIPDVLEAAVFAVPDEDTGEAAVAMLSVKEGSDLDEAKVKAHVAAHLASYKVPAVVQLLVDSLPRNPAGKLLKVQLRNTYLGVTEG